MPNNEGPNFFLTRKFFLILGLCSFTLTAFLWFSTRASYSRETKDVVIQRGKSLGQVAELLVHEGIIQHPFQFKIFARITGGTSRVKAGEYRFQKGMSSLGALLVLYHSDPVLHPVTIPEGYSVKQIAQLLAMHGLVNEQKFIQIALSKTSAEKYHLKAPHLEGFLFPDTYGISKIDGEEKIIERMVQRFFAEYERKYKSQLATQSLSLEQWVTLASIVEKETGAAEERPLVASVFHNRLKKRMRLQSDPTTIYGIPNFTGNIHKSDLLKHTPYNTYTIPALPPGPIASPGSASLDAVLHPAVSDYLYFVSNNQGRHIFSVTYGQHNRHVNAYQPEIARLKNPRVPNAVKHGTKKDASSSHKKPKR